MDEPSITDLKSTFIRTQVRLLETPLEPSPTDESTLSSKLITDLVSKVNEKIKQHNRLIFSTQSQRHVAEQIESLHWNLVEADTEHTEIDTVVVRRDAELTDKHAVMSLPEDYDDLFLHPDHGREEEEAQRYSELRQDMIDVSHKRDVLNMRLARYEEMKQLIAPLDEPQKNVQQNLVTRDGELSRELDRMRVLLARVTGRVKDVGLSTRADSETKAPIPQTNQQKLAQLMELG